MKKNYWIFLLMSLFFVSQHAVAQEELPYCVPEYVGEAGNPFEKYTNTYVETITVTNGDAQQIWEKGDAARVFYNVTGLSVDAKAGETVNVRLQAFSLGDYTESSVLQDLRFTAAVMAIDWDHDGTFEYVEKIAGNTPPTHNVGGNMDVFDISKDIVVPADATPGVARVRVNYTNAWFGELTAADFVCTCKEGIVYDFDIAVVEEQAGPCMLTIVQPENGSFTVVDEVTGEALNAGEVEPGTAVRVEETPDPGYWLKYVVVNGAPIEGRNFVIEEDVEVTVEFTDMAVLNWTIEGEGTFRIPDVVEATSEAGSVELSGDQRLCFTPARDYDLTLVEIEGEDVTETLAYDDVNKEFYLDYTVPQQQEVAVRVVFEERVQEYAVTYTVSGDGELVLKKGDVVVNSGETFMVGTVLTGTLVYDEAVVTCSEVLVNGNEVDFTDNTFTVEVTEETAISVVFEDIVYAVSFSAGEHGTIQVKAGEQELVSGDEVKAGTELTVLVAPEEKYLLESLTVNGVDHVADVTDGQYVFTVDAATTIHATFKEDGSGIHSIMEAVYYDANARMLVAPVQAKVVLYNVVGAFVAQSEGSLNMAALPNGLYLAKVMFNGEVRTMKLLKK